MDEITLFVKAYARNLGYASEDAVRRTVTGFINGESGGDEGHIIDAWLLWCEARRDLTNICEGVDYPTQPTQEEV